MAINRDTYLFPARRERDDSFSENVRPAPEESARERFEQMRLKLGEGFHSWLVEELAFIDALPENPLSSRRMECLASGASFVINWQGMLRPCIMLNEPEAPVFELGFEEAWRIIREKTDTILLPEPCGRCRLRTICEICAAAGILENKDGEAAPIYLCRRTRELERLMRLEVDHG